MKTGFWKKHMAILLCVVMVASMLPISAVAADLSGAVAEGTAVAPVEEIVSETVEVQIEEVAEEPSEGSAGASAEETQAAGSASEIIAEETVTPEYTEVTEAKLPETMEYPMEDESSVEAEPVIAELNDAFCADVGGTSVLVNGVYEGLWQEQNVLDALAGTASALSESEAECFSGIEEAAGYVRSSMVSRAADIQFALVVDLGEAQSQEAIDEVVFGVLNEILDAALSHTGEAKEGDYLSGQMGGWSAGYSGTQVDDSASYAITYSVQPVYFTSAAQEEYVTAEVAEILESLAFDSSTSDYRKVKAIYDYICDCVAYDYAHYQDEISSGSCADYIPHSAYGALANGIAVCQGYSALFYRLALEVGIDVRMIAGTSGGERHSWNIVKLGDYYYNLDATWGASQSAYSYFLRSDSGFDNHVRDAEYTGSFYDSYPMAGEDYVLESEIVWSYDEETQVLTVGGVGPVESAPWSYLNSSAIEVVVEDGVTSLCDCAFENFYNMTKLALPDSVTEIGIWCFNNCTNLLELEIPSGITEIKAYSFAGCDSLTSINIPDSVQSIEFDAFAWCDNLETVSIGKNAKVVEFLRNPFNECSSLKTIVVSPENTGLKVVDGSLIGIEEEYVAMAGGEYLLCGPMASTGSYTIPDGVVYLCPNSFGGSQLSELVIPEGVLGFDDPIHRMPNITSLTLPASLSYYDANLFECNNLHDIWVAEGNEYFSNRDGLLYDADGETLLAYPQGRREKVLVIPEGTKQIGICDDFSSTFLFYNDSTVETIILPQGLETLGSGVFKDADCLKRIYVPSSVTSIYMGAFSQPPFAVGHDVTIILDAAEGTLYDHFTTFENLYADYNTSFSFAMKSGCPQITFDVNGTADQVESMSYNWGDEFGELPVPEWEDHYFLGWYTKADEGEKVKSSDVVLASQTLYAHWAEKTTAGSCGENLTWTLYGDSVLVFSGYGAMNDYNIYAFDMPWADYRFTIDTVILPDGLTHIGSKAFFCIGMTEINIPDTVTSIGAAAFSSCQKLESIAIPEGVKSLEENTFWNNYALNSIYLPASLTSISDDYCFGCSQYDANYNGDTPKVVYYYGTESQWAGLAPDSLDHAKVHFVVKADAVAPTCTESGLTEGEYCSECGEVLFGLETIRALGHTVVTDEAVVPTCTETGLTEGSHCSVCGEVLTAQTIVDALGHSFSNGACTVCGANEVLPGDVNEDGEVTIADAVRIARYDAGYVELTESQMLAADTNGDGEVTIADAVRIARYDAGYIDEL